MAIGLGDNLGVTGPLPTDNRYYNTSNNKPWTSCSEVNLALTGERYTGLTVNINGAEYWYKEGVLDACLIPKESAGTITGGTNGLSTDGANICLGGTLSDDIGIATLTHSFQMGTGLYGSFLFNTGATSISSWDGATGIGAIGVGDGKFFALFTDEAEITDGSGSGLGLQYAADYKGTFTSESLVSKAYVDCVAAAGGTITGGANGLSTSGTNVILGGALDNNTAIGGADTHFLRITGLSTGQLHSDGAMSVCSTSGGLTLKDCYSGFEICVGGSTYNDEGPSGTKGIKYADDYSASGDNPRWIPDAAWVTGQTGGANGANGICSDGDNLVLGGELTGDTVIDACDKCFSIINACEIILDATGSSATLTISAAGTVFTDSESKGICYGGNYDATGNPNMLTNAQYVTGCTVNLIQECGGSLNMSGSTVGGLTTYVDANTVCAHTGLTFNGTCLSSTKPIKITGSSTIVGNMTLESIGDPQLRFLRDCNETYGKCALGLISYDKDSCGMEFRVNDEPTPRFFISDSGETCACGGMVVANGITADTIQITTGAASGCVLQSDASGNATWSTPSGGISWNDSEANGIGTYVNASCICPSDLTYDGTKLLLSGAAKEFVIACGGAKCACMDWEATCFVIDVAGTNMSLESQADIYMKPGQCVDINGLTKTSELEVTSGNIAMCEGSHRCIYMTPQDSSSTAANALYIIGQERTATGAQLIFI